MGAVLDALLAWVDGIGPLGWIVIGVVAGIALVVLGAAGIAAEVAGVIEPPGPRE